MNRNSNAYLEAVANPFYAVSVTPTVLAADAYDAGDVIFTGAELALAVPDVGGYARLMGWQVTDVDDEGAQLDIYLTQLSTVFAALDAAPSISDANMLAANIQGHPLSTGTYKDVGGFKMFGQDNVNKIVKAAAGTRSLYVHGISSGTPTFTAVGDLKLTFWFSKV